MEIFCTWALMGTDRILERCVARQSAGRKDGRRKRTKRFRGRSVWLHSLNVGAVVRFVLPGLYQFLLRRAYSFAADIELPWSGACSCSRPKGSRDRTTANRDIKRGSGGNALGYRSWRNEKRREGTGRRGGGKRKEKGKNYIRPAVVEERERERIEITRGGGQ